MEIIGVLNHGYDDDLPLNGLFLAPGPARHQPEEYTCERLVSRLPIKTSKVREAMTLIPRNQFAPHVALPESLSDRPIMTAMGFNISAPHMHAMLLEELDLQPGHRVLDVGSGSGLLSAYAAFIVGTSGAVVGVDTLNEATKMARENVEQQRGTNSLFERQAAQCSFHTNNIFLPDPVLSTLKGFDRIVCGAACPDKKRYWLLNMLKPEGGMLLTPMIGGTLEKTTRAADGKLTTDCLSMVRFKDLEVPTDWQVVKAMLGAERKAFLSFPSSESTFSKDNLLLGGLLCPEADPTSGHKRSRELQIESWQWLSAAANLAKGEPHILDSRLGAFDCQLLGCGWSLFAHRQVLSSRCDLFRAQSLSGMRDSESCEIRLLEEFGRDAVEAFLFYCYTDRLEGDLDPTAVIDCLEVATFCGAPYLIHLCELTLALSLGASSGKDAATKDELAPRLLSAANDYNLSHLRCCAIDYISFNFRRVASTKAYQRLPKELVDAVAAHACSQLKLIDVMMESMENSTPYGKASAA